MNFNCFVVAAVHVMAGKAVSHGLHFITVVPIDTILFVWDTGVCKRI
jgi:hypothetical protein